MSRELKRQLKGLKHEAINPRGEWISKNREVLLSQITNTLPATRGPQTTEAKLEKFWAGMAVFLPRPFVYNVMRPIAVLVLVSLVATTAYSGTVKASNDSLPGDFLYPAKRAAERTQGAVISLIGDKNAETKYHVDLANRRATEARQIITTKKDDPNKVAKVAATVAELKTELNSINEKLANTETKQALQADVAKDVKQNTEAIKDVLQDMKDDLAMSATVEEKDLAQQVTETKDLVKDVSVKAVEVMVEKHLGGDQSVSNEEVKAVIVTSIDNVAGEVLASQQVMNGAQTIVESVKTQVKTLETELKKSASEIQKSDAASTTKEFSDKVISVASSTKEAVAQAKVATAEVDQKISEARAAAISGDLTKVVDKLKEVNEATKAAEKISDKTIEKAQEVIPFVQVIKDTVIPVVASSSSALNVSSTQEIISLFTSTTPVQLPTSSVKLVTSTVPFVVKIPTTTAPVVKAASTTADKKVISN